MLFYCLSYFQRVDKHSFRSRERMRCLNSCYGNVNIVETCTKESEIKKYSLNFKFLFLVFINLH